MGSWPRLRPSLSRRPALAGSDLDCRAADKDGAAAVQIRAGAPPYPCAGESPTTSGGRAAGTAAELREITEVLGKLGQLHAGGVLTEQEFSEQ